MARNELAPKGKKQYLSTTTILQDAGLRAKLQNYIDETLICKTAILDKQESIKTLRQTACDDLDMDPKMFSQLVSLYHNNNFDQKLADLEELEEVINTLLKKGIGQ